MSFVTLQSSPVDFQQAEHVLKQSAQFIAQMQNEEEQSLLELEQAELINYYLKKFPTQTLKYLIDNNIAAKCVRELLNPPDLEYAPNQRHVLSESIIAKAMRTAIPVAQKQGDDLSRKYANEAAELLATD